MSARVGLAALAVAALAAALLPGNRVGLAAAVVGAGLVAIAWRATRERGVWPAALLVLAAALAISAVLRDAAWIVTLDLMAAAIACVAAVTGAATWRALAAGVAATAWRVVPAWPAIARATAGPVTSGRVRALAPVARGLALGALAMIVFGALFVSADDAFAEIVDDNVVPHWELGLLPARAFTFASVAALAGAIALTAGAGPVTTPAAGRRGDLSRAEWALPLVLLNVLFASFVAVQIAVLFGGHDHVLTTAGLTYAEYARAGFWELVVVAALTLGVIAFAVRRAAVTGAGDRRLLQVLLGVLCALTFVVLASALRRLGLYEEAFGFTRARLMAHVAILLLGAVFVLVVVAGALRRSDWLPRSVVTLAAATFAALTLANPDGLIAARNVDRYEATGKLDADYVRALSADAVPALAGLPERLGVLDEQRARLADPDGWPELNVGRERARAALR